MKGLLYIIEKVSDVIESHLLKIAEYTAAMDKDWSGLTGGYHTH